MVFQNIHEKRHEMSHFFRGIRNSRKGLSIQTSFKSIHNTHNNVQWQNILFHNITSTFLRL